MRLRAITILLLPALTSCSVWFFSGEHYYDRSRPVALVETTGGVELGATTEFGVLTLGGTADEGPCRVRYFLGPTPMVDDGALLRLSPTFVRAEIDLKTQAVRCLDRSPTPRDELLAMWTAEGTAVETVAVRLAQRDRVHGDVLEHPGRTLPPGAALFTTTEEDGLLFVGLVAAEATLDGARFYVFAGPDRLREMLAIPTRHPVDMVPKYRTDDISVLKPREPAEPPPQPTTAPSPLPPLLQPK
ncbi:MAG: hypothetical protein JNL08_18855 [Planctomycetes bacterium]|nr:hypothetical protein [Planctomycetota bacterium]